MVKRLISKPTYLIKLYSGGVIPKYQLGDMIHWRNIENPIFPGIRNILETPQPKQIVKDPTADYNSLRYEYIKALENPNLVGYDAKNDRWTRPTLRGYDPYQIGIGLDTRYNEDVKRFFRLHKRDWLTNAEMLDLLNKSFDYFEKVFDRNTKNTDISNVKRAVAMGLLYHGHGPKLWNKSHPLSKALFNGTDQQFIDAVTKFYGRNTRANRNSEFWQKTLN